MRVDADSPTRAHAPVAVPARAALEEVLPSGVVVARDGKNLTLRYGWPRWNGGVLGIFAAVWNGMFLPPLLRGDLPIVLAITHGVAGFGFAYLALGWLLNETRVELSFGHLSVRHGPIPWRGHVDATLEELEQLHVISRRIRTKNGHRTAYDLVVDQKSGPRVLLLQDVATREHAEAIERAIEQHLGIEDRPNDVREGW